MQYETSRDLVDYDYAINTMEQRVANIVAGDTPELLWLVEHPSLYTGGTSANTDDLLDSKKFPVYKTGRGGEYTYHGPGQRVAYVMLNLKERGAKDIKAYICGLEQWVINTLAVFGVKGERRQGRVGIWVVLNNGQEAKIGAIGIRIRKWVTYHGIALNVNPDLSHYGGIVPCGISQHSVTSLHDLGVNIPMTEVDDVLKKEFQKLFVKD